MKGDRFFLLTLYFKHGSFHQFTHCSALKFIIAFERRMRKNTQFYTEGDEDEI